MKKKILIIGLATAMSLGLCACSKDDKTQSETTTETRETESYTNEDQPDAAKVPELTVVTAEDLIQNHRDNVKSASGTMKIVIDIDYPVDENEVGEDEQQYLENGYASVLNLEAEVQTASDENASHAVGSMSMSMFGFNYQMPMESYVDFVNHKTYNYNSDEETATDEWIVSIMSDDDTSDATQGALADLLDAALTETEDSYVITGKLSAADMGIDLLGATSTDSLDASCLCDAVYTFDKKTQFLTSYQYDLSAAYSNEDYEDAVCVFIVSGTMYDHNATVVEIPEDVIVSAVVDTESSFEYDYEDEYEENIVVTVFNAEYLSNDNLIDTWLYRYPMIGLDYEMGSNDDIDNVIRKLARYVNYCSDSELTEEWEYISAMDKYEIAAMLLLGDLYDISDEYKEALSNSFSDMDTNQTIADGFNLYLDICGLNE